jgi:parallel beta-helix repeat protein
LARGRDNMSVNVRHRKVWSGKHCAVFTVALLVCSLVCSCAGLVNGQIGTIWIKADGSVFPSTAPISTTDFKVYNFQSNVSLPIEIDRDNIVLDGQGYFLQPNGSTDYGVSITNRVNVTVQNVKINGFTSGIYGSGSSLCSILNNAITNSGYGVSFVNSQKNLISKNSISKCGDYAVWLRSSTENVISENSLSKNNYDAIYLVSSQNNVINGNQISANNEGILLEGSSSNYLTANTVTDCNGVDMWSTTSKGYGVHLISSSNNNINGNSIQTSVNDGVLLEASSSNTLAANTLTGNADGVRIQSSTNNTVSKNIIEQNKEYGIKLEACSATQILGNTIVNDGKNGGWIVSSENNYLAGNIIEDNTKNGLAFYASNFNTVEANNITSNGCGVYFEHSSNNTVCRNNFVENQIQASVNGGIETWTDGSNSRGNYWSDYAAKYPNASVILGAGVENMTYFINENNVDALPLANLQATDIKIPELPVLALIPMAITVSFALIVKKRQNKIGKH